MPHTYEYPRPSLTADCVIFKDNQVLLIRRKDAPFANMWAFPGGFANEGEEPLATALRELQEETGVIGVELELVGVFGKPKRDPRGWVVSVAFLADVTGREIHPVAADDAADTMWVSADTFMQLAFDHNDILAEALRVRKRCT